MKDLLNFILAQIVDNPDKISIDEQQVSDGNFQYTIHAQGDDTGKIIGRDGKIISAIRNIAKVLAIKENTHIHIEIA